MKKEALAFFTMFSLILMLSIYYITLPKENKTTMKYESVISSLQENKEDNREDTIIANEGIISDPNASMKEKEEAISENEQIKANTEKEKELHASIKEMGYDNDIEIKDKTIYVNVVNQKEEDDIAISIMKHVYAKEGNKYLIEVSFISE